MPDIHVSMLALDIPNLLPKSVPWPNYGPGGRASPSTTTRLAAPGGPPDLVDADLRDRHRHRLPADQEAQAGRAGDLGPDDSRCDVRVGDDGPRVRHDPARVVDVRRRRTSTSTRRRSSLRQNRVHPLRHHEIGRDRHRDDGHLRDGAGAPGLVVREVAEAPRARTRAPRAEAVEAEHRQRPAGAPAAPPREARLAPTAAPSRRSES